MALDPALRGKAGVVTGGVRGIGLGIARGLASEGVDLAIADLERDETAIEELRSLGTRVYFLQTDLSCESDVIAMIRQAHRELGRVDLFVNNAARALHEAVTRITTEAFYATVNTNLTACVWACRDIAPQMIERRSGSILIVGSTVRVCPAYREAAYRISKMGLKMYMETLAIELAPFGIRVNMLTPGHHVTRLTAGIPREKEAGLKHEIPLRRFGQPLDIGPSAVFLLSDKLSPYTTGADLVVDGGLALRPLALASDEDIAAINV